MDKSIELEKGLKSSKGIYTSLRSSDPIWLAWNNSVSAEGLFKRKYKNWEFEQMLLRAIGLCWKTFQNHFDCTFYSGLELPLFAVEKEEVDQSKNSFRKFLIAILIGTQTQSYCKSPILEFFLHRLSPPKLQKTVGCTTFEGIGFVERIKITTPPSGLVLLHFGQGNKDCNEKKQGQKKNHFPEKKNRD